MVDLKPGQIKLSECEKGLGGKSQDELGDTGSALFLLMVLLVLGMLGSSPSPSDRPSRQPLQFCTDKGTHKAQNCLPSAPKDIRRIALLSYNDAIHRYDPVVHVIDAPFVRIHAVKRLPERVRAVGIEIRAGISPSDGRLVTGRRPLIFSGDVNVQVGPIRARDVMLSKLTLGNSIIKEVESLYVMTRPRGPPETHSLQEPIDVYVLGAVRDYQGPEQSERSVHLAQVFDVKVAPSPTEKQEYNQRVTEWRRMLAEKTGFPVYLFASVTTNAQASRITENSLHGHKGSSSASLVRKDEVRRPPRSMMH